MDELFKADVLGHLPADHPDWPMWASENYDKVQPEEIAARIDDYVKSMMENPVKASMFLGNIMMCENNMLRTVMMRSQEVINWIKRYENLLNSSIQNDPNRRPAGICFKPL